MNKPDYKHLGEIGAKAVLNSIGSRDYNETFARAVIEEDRRLRMEEVGEGMASVEDCGNEYASAASIYPALKGIRAVRNLLLTVFEKQLEVEKAHTQHHINLQLEAESAHCQLEAKLAAAKKRLGELEWKPVSVKPTREDADVNGWVVVLRKNGSTAHHKWDWAFPFDVIQWCPTALPPAPTAEDIELAEFEKLAKSKNWNVEKLDGEFITPNTRMAFEAWQARAAKEDK